MNDEKLVQSFPLSPLYLKVIELSGWEEGVKEVPKEVYLLGKEKSRSFTFGTQRGE